MQDNVLNSKIFKLLFIQENDAILIQLWSGRLAYGITKYAICFLTCFH